MMSACVITLDSEAGLDPEIAICKIDVLPMKTISPLFSPAKRSREEVEKIGYGCQFPAGTERRERGALAKARPLSASCRDSSAKAARRNDITRDAHR